MAQIQGLGLVNSGTIEKARNPKHVEFLQALVEDLAENDNIIQKVQDSYTPTVESLTPAVKQTSGKEPFKVQQPRR